jgi:hypothetical protein
MSWVTNSFSEENMADDYTDDSDTQATGDGSQGNGTPDPQQATAAVANAAPAAAEAHKSLLDEALGMLSGQGVDLDQLAQSYGLPHVDVNNLNPAQLVQLTQQLAQQHPEILQSVAQRFPEAQGLLGMLTGSGGQGGGGFLGGILGRFLGG